MDNIRKYKDADQFLHALKLTVKANVVVKVLKVITGETPGSIYDLYSSGKRRNGTHRTALCGKGTVYKIKRLYKNGELDSFLEFIKFKVLEPDFKFLIADFEKKKTGQEARATFQKLINDWEAEITLPLGYLDIEDVSDRKTGVNIDREITLIWEIMVDGRIERRFWIEDNSEFFNLQKAIPGYLKLWAAFEECKRLGGLLINQCSKLIIEIRNQSEIKTRLMFAIQDHSRPDKIRLDRFFAWTIYADALNVLPDQHTDKPYRWVDMGLDAGQIYCGDFPLAIVKHTAKDIIAHDHEYLRAFYKNSTQTKAILEVKDQLNDVETRLRKELEIIGRCLNNY